LEGEEGSWRDLLSQADSEGLSMSLRARGHIRRSGAAHARTTVLSIVGPPGTTRAFFREVREAAIRRLGTDVGLPRPHRCPIVACTLQGAQDSGEALPPEDLPEDTGAATEDEAEGAEEPPRQQGAVGDAISEVDWSPDAAAAAPAAPAEAAAAPAAAEEPLTGLPPELVDLAKYVLGRLEDCRVRKENMLGGGVLRNRPQATPRPPTGQTRGCGGVRSASP
jgi:hypothetical protein